MNDFIILLIEYFRQYNIWFLGLLIILQFNGIPVGANFVVIASGVLAYLGEFSIMTLLAQVWLFTLLGDSLSFFFWHRVGEYFFTRFPFIKGLFAQGLHKAESHFARYGGITIFVTRFPISALGPVVNISAGTARLKYSSFVIPALFGDLIWTVFNLGVGYWFGDSWEEAAVLVGQMGWMIILMLGFLAAVYVFWRLLIKKGNKASGQPASGGDSNKGTVR